jgi:hypothetical protein
MVRGSQRLLDDRSSQTRDRCFTSRQVVKWKDGLFPVDRRRGRSLYFSEDLLVDAMARLRSALLY